MTRDYIPTPQQVYSACLSYRHDFGLLDPVQRDTLMIEAQMWLKAWRKEFNVSATLSSATPAGGGLTAEAFIESSFGKFTAYDYDDVVHIVKAALAASPVPMSDTGAQEVPSEHQQLRKFYSVSTDAELIEAQARHIEKLQAKLPALPSLAPQRVREG